MTDESKRTTEGPTGPESYWLQVCHGFKVVSPRGRVGIVEDVLYGDEKQRPSALAVRGGLFGTHVELVPVEDVAQIVPRSKLLSLRATEERVA